MRKILGIAFQVVKYVLAFTLPVAALAAAGFYSTLQLTMPRPAPPAIPAAGAGSLSTKPYDPAKSTVAVVLGSERTEVTDFLIPYEIFSASGAYNVYAVAPDREMVSLSGGLEVLPDYSYPQLSMLLGKSPDVVVIPAIPDPASVGNEPVLSWIRQQAAQGSYIFSICVGAEVFAATGLLDGRTATTHWADIDRIEQQYPAVNWVRGVRYVDGESEGNYMTSAGITSGIDAVLHYLARHNGESVARAVSAQLHYPSYRYAAQPQVEQQSAGAALTVVGLLNILFHPAHPTAGVLLYSGIGELELASTYDTYAASYTTKLLSVSQARQLVTTQHGLQIVPRYSFDDIPSVDRLIVPGSRARLLAGTIAGAWSSKGASNGKAAPVTYLHADHPDEFAFDGPLRDLAHQENIPTAVLNAKRLEYRPGIVQSRGPSWPLWLTVQPILLGLAGVAAVRTVSMRRRSSPSSRPSSRPTSQSGETARTPSAQASPSSPIPPPASPASSH